MTNNGWRTVIVDSKSTISLENQNIVIQTEDERKTIAISQVQTLLINSKTTIVTVALLNALASQNVKLILCNEKCNPSCEMVPYSGNVFSAGRLKKQIAWNDEQKGHMWQQIISRKIECQASVIRSVNPAAYKKLCEYANDVEPSDATNREGQAGRVYFRCLFGKDFKRREESNVNSALNYGYAILLSSINRIVSVYGYNMSLGIKHSNAENMFNLSCDLIEPFRPVVDLVVYRNGDRVLDYEYKKELIQIGYSEMYYGNRKMTVNTALEQYISDFFKAMSSSKKNVKEIRLAA